MPGAGFLFANACGSLGVERVKWNKSLFFLIL